MSNIDFNGIVLGGIGDAVEDEDAVNRRTALALIGGMVASAALPARANAAFLTPPAGFDWPGLPFAKALCVRRLGLGSYNLEWPFFDIPSTEAPGAVGQKYFVDPIGGLDTNVGTSSSSPLKTIDAALSKADALEIILAPGDYINSWSSATPATQKATIRVSGNGVARVILGTKAASWSTTGTPGIFKSRDSSYSLARNLLASGYADEYGNPLLLTEYSSLTSMGSAVGWTKNGTSDDIFVRLPDGVSPVGKELIALRHVAGPAINSGTRYHLSGVHFYGGGNGLVLNAPNAFVTMHRVGFIGSSGNGLNADNMKSGLILDRCFGYGNEFDLFNYHDDRTNKPCLVIEKDCSGTQSGFGNSGTPNCNISTAHDTSKVVRINCLYGNSRGPVVVDIDAAQSWNIAVDAFGAQPGYASFQCGNNSSYGVTKMWFDGCASKGSDIDILTGPGGGAHQAFIREFSGNNITVSAGTTVAAY